MKMLNNTKEQQDVLVQLLTTAAKRLTAFEFNEPDSDQRNLRQHAFIKGQFDLLKTLLEDDFEAEQPVTQGE